MATSEELTFESITASIAADKARLEEAMPDVHAALQQMNDAYRRLEMLGWKDAIYCPKDGTIFEAIEAGSVGVHHCHYDGKWPKGYWWVHSAGDLWPSRPILWRALASNQGGAA